MSSDQTANVQNNLKNNAYPGRGIIIGADKTGKKLIQVYWIMGRSDNSRNRIFEKTADGIRTRAHDESKVEDPSLIIYNCMRTAGTSHVVTNGDQTDTVCDHLASGTTFETALATRTFEPDAPNYTPRISGIIYLAGSEPTYKLNILLAQDNNPDNPLNHTWTFGKMTPGAGHCIHTYQTDGNPLPPFAGEPYPVPLTGTPEEIADFYWSNLDPDNRISLAVKAVDAVTGNVSVNVINKHA